MDSNKHSLQLFASPNTYAIGVHLLLEECKVPYRIINPKADPALTQAAFISASPHGRVPALVLADGSTMCESGAIALHLADTFCDQKFSVPVHATDRARYLQWLFYLSSTLQPEVMIVFHPEYYFSDNAQQAQLKTAAEKRLIKVWDVLEKQYINGSWMFSQGPTAVDFALANVLLWPECFPSSSGQYPALSSALKSLSERESFKRVIPWHQKLTDDVPDNTMIKS